MTDRRPRVPDANQVDPDLIDAYYKDLLLQVPTTGSVELDHALRAYARRLTRAL
jgi:hypothetical protein